MAALIPYLISNIFQIGAYAFCMAYLTGELAELKKRPLTTGISFIVMYFTSIIIQRYDNDWVTIGLSLILSLYCLLLYLNTSKTLSQCFNIVICGYLIETLCQCIFILLFTILRVPLDANGYNDPISLSIVFLGALLQRLYPFSSCPKMGTVSGEYLLLDLAYRYPCHDRDLRNESEI